MCTHLIASPKVLFASRRRKVIRGPRSNDLLLAAGRLDMAAKPALEINPR